MGGEAIAKNDDYLMLCEWGESHYYFQVFTMSLFFFDQMWNC